MSDWAPSRPVLLGPGDGPSAEESGIGAGMVNLLRRAL
ncbi:hypothetical protein JOF34_002292 [Microbacterium amylolyticum]|uniref:Uncharacterized protein n=1 Tax=Microbacterium amylolyticum TaxID=936337 RepID=A0ABS4ZKA1_9MICO|nr:hypothetical protein [Microbacterium amylolyticum]